MGVKSRWVSGCFSADLAEGDDEEGLRCLEEEEALGVALVEAVGWAAFRWSCARRESASGDS